MSPSHSGRFHVSPSLSGVSKRSASDSNLDQGSGHSSLDGRWQEEDSRKEVDGENDDDEGMCGNVRRGMRGRAFRESAGRARLFQLNEIVNI